jgi:hypothetical protein
MDEINLEGSQIERYCIPIAYVKANINNPAYIATHPKHKPIINAIPKNYTKE